MKENLLSLLKEAIKTVGQELNVDLSSDNITIENSKNKAHGDYATNAALVLAKQASIPPRALAEKLTAHLSADYLAKTDIAGPGFINFTLNSKEKSAIVASILKEQEHFGSSELGKNERVIVEYVSANPTGPLHVGHGRGAAFGASLVNLLRNQGYDVHSEYYVNDAGRQMAILAVSTYLRYLEAFDMSLTFPSNGYKGAYVNDIAKDLKQLVGDKYVTPLDKIFDGLPKDAPEGDKEVYIDALTDRCKELLGPEGFKTIFDFGLNAVLDGIKADLATFGVTFDQWFSEYSLVTSGAIDKGLNTLKEKGYLYEKEGATWFKSSELGDEKDRVLKRANGQTTYFASDVAYHWNKQDRGFAKTVYIFGADHHGYVARVKAAAKALGFDDKAIEVLLVQFAILYRGEERVQMSTRSGEFVTLKELYDEVGVDAARFFYCMRKSSQHMDFDLELAKSSSSDNPVYYVQYAHARVASVFRTLQEKQLSYDETLGLASLDSLSHEKEQELLAHLAKYPQMLKSAAQSYEPHQIAYYCRELALKLHTYYNAIQFIVDDEAIRNARLALIKAVKQVLKNGLNLIGVNAPETM